MLETLPAFLVVAFLFGMAPGTDVLLVIRRTTKGGVPAGIAVALGAATGSLAWGIAAAVGLAKLLAQSAIVYEVLRLAGAAYLMWLGITSIIATIHHRATTPVADDETAAPTPQVAAQAGWLRSFGSGLFADLLNPKMGAFYLALLPQFIPPGHDVMRTSMVLAGVEFFTAAVCMIAYAVLAGRMLRLITKPVVARWLDRTVGTVLVGLGVHVALNA